MRFSTLATTVLPTLASARIIGLSTPSILTPSSPFNITLLTENYIQSVSDIAVAWGFQTPTAAYPKGYPFTLGSFGNSSYLGPKNSNTLENVTIEAVVPEGLVEGQNQVFGVAVMSLYGASGGPLTQGWNITVKIGGGQESAGIVESTEVGWRENGDCQA